MDDPAEVQGDGETKRRDFWRALQLISRRVDLLVALPVHKLERLTLEKRVQAIGREEGRPTAAPT